MNESHDVIVIGGGPGGSCTASRLADAGLDVVLLERDQFPREHVGESLLPASIPILERLGVMEEVEAAGFVTKRGATMVWGSDPEPWSWYFSEAHVRHPTSFQVVRAQFDAILLENARRHGVQVRERHQVLDVRFEGERAVGVDYRVDGNEQGLDARFVVDASGQAAILSRKLAVQRWDDSFRNLAVYGYYKDAQRLPAPNDGNIFIEAFEHGWLWMIPLHTGVASVGAVVDSEIGQQGIRELGTQQFLTAQIDQAPHLRELLRAAALVGEAQLVRDWSYASTSVAGDGFVLVGDAACFIDPLFSSGVHLALSAGELASAYVRSSIIDPSIRASAAEVYEALYNKQYGHFRALAQLFYASNRTADSYFWEARRLVGDDASTPRQAFIKAVAGQPPGGYERVVIDRGEPPPELADELRLAEQELARREATLAALVPADPRAQNPLLDKVPSLAPTFELKRRAVLAGSIFEWGQVAISPGQSEGAPVSALAAGFLSKVDGVRTVAEIIEALQDETRAPSDAIAANLLSVIAVLFVDGIVEALVDR